jgi:hypothetical protein
MVISFPDFKVAVSEAHITPDIAKNNDESKRNDDFQSACARVGMLKRFTHFSSP